MHGRHAGSPARQGDGHIQVGISVYQQSLDWLKQCIQSAQRQTIIELMITVRTDGPEACDQASLNWLRESANHDPRIHLIESNERLGTFGSYKAIFDSACTEFLCQLDGDDWLAEDALSIAKCALEGNKDAPFSYTDCTEVNADGVATGIGSRSMQPFCHQRMLVQFITFHLRLIRRSSYAACGGYDETLLYTGDYDLSLKLCEEGRPIHIPKPLYFYRLHTSNTSSLRKKETISEAFTVAEKALIRRKQNHLFGLRLNPEACQVSLAPKLGPVVIAGMHRSGTSLLALMLQALGLDLGEELLHADDLNPDGYLEDLCVVQLQRELLQHWTRQCTDSWPDWGWPSDEIAAKELPPIWTGNASDYLEKRQRNDRYWGWKDPRSTLLLEHWLALEPGLRVIGIYRHPWEVIDALQRVRPPVFLENPGWALQIWLEYNQALLRFAKDHPERCVLVNSTALRRQPDSLPKILEQRWGWEYPRHSNAQGDQLQSFIRRDRLRSLPDDDPLIWLHKSCHAGARELLRDLDQAADLPSPGSQQPDPTPNRWAAMNGSPMRKAADLAVIITSHNQGDLLLEALASVMRHADSDQIELLIVDDGSTDPRTVDILQSLSRIGFRVLRQHQQGLPVARNAGLSATQAPILLFLDDDNRLLAPYLVQGVAMLKRHASIDVVYGNRNDFGFINQLHRVGSICSADLWTMNRIDNCALIRRSLLDRCGGYTAGLPAFEDWDLWLTALAQPEGLKLGYLDQPCFEYRVRPNSMLQRLLSNPELQRQLMQQLRQRHGDRVGHGGFRPAPTGDS